MMHTLLFSGPQVYKVTLAGYLTTNSGGFLCLEFHSQCYDKSSSRGAFISAKNKYHTYRHVPRKACGGIPGLSILFICFQYLDPLGIQLQ